MRANVPTVRESAVLVIETPSRLNLRLALKVRPIRAVLRSWLQALARDGQGSLRCSNDDATLS